MTHPKRQPARQVDNRHCDGAEAGLGFKHLVDIEGVTGSIPVAPTTQSSRTAETVVDRK
jgi:hypothetical protein